jgi:hypothetical protein
MIAAPSLISQLERAKATLEDAQIALCGAVITHAEAKRALEYAEAAKLCEGVDGKNEGVRAAKLWLELEAEYTALAEDALTDARCSWEVARMEWELARYKVRAMEVHGMEVAA